MYTSYLYQFTLSSTLKQAPLFWMLPFSLCCSTCTCLKGLILIGYGENTSMEMTVMRYTNLQYSNLKTNVSNNNEIPEELKVFQGAVTSELIDPKNRNKSQCYISTKLLEVLLQLIKFQREWSIVIKKRCAKRA